MPITPQGRASIVILPLAGEIDLLTRPALDIALYSGLQAKPRHLVVDLSAVTFCGACGLSALAVTAFTAAEHRIRYAVSGLSPHLARAAATAWTSHEPTRYRSLALAVTAIRAAQARRG